MGGGGACEEEELPSKQTDSKSQKCCNSNKNPIKTRGVALPFTLKSIRAKEEFWKVKYFTMQNYNLQKNPLIEETKILQDIL